MLFECFLVDGSQVAPVSWRYNPAGGRPPRFSTDTGTSNSTAAAGQSWTSSVSSTTPTPQAPPPSAATPPATAHSPRAGPSAAVLQAGSPGRAGSGGGGPAPAGLALQASVAAKPTRYMSGPRMDPHWDFGQTEVKPVRVMLQVSKHRTWPSAGPETLAVSQL